MPIYDYACTKCEHAIEDKLVTNGDLIQTCPKCGDVMERDFPSTGHFQLKGEDWSKDGYALNKGEDTINHE